MLSRPKTSNNTLKQNNNKTESNKGNTTETCEFSGFKRHSAYAEEISLLQRELETTVSMEGGGPLIGWLNKKYSNYKEKWANSPSYDNVPLRISSGGLRRSSSFHGRGSRPVTANAVASLNPHSSTLPPPGMGTVTYSSPTGDGNVKNVGLVGGKVTPTPGAIQKPLISVPDGTPPVTISRSVGSAGPTRNNTAIVITNSGRVSPTARPVTSQGMTDNRHQRQSSPQRQLSPTPAPDKSSGFRPITVDSILSSPIPLYRRSALNQTQCSEGANCDSNNLPNSRQSVSQTIISYPVTGSVGLSKSLKFRDPQKSKQIYIQSELTTWEDKQRTLSEPFRPSRQGQVDENNFKNLCETNDPKKQVIRRKTPVTRSRSLSSADQRRRESMVFSRYHNTVENSNQKQQNNKSIHTTEHSSAISPGTTGSTSDSNKVPQTQDNNATPNSNTNLSDSNTQSTVQVTHSIQPSSGPINNIQTSNLTNIIPRRAFSRKKIRRKSSIYRLNHDITIPDVDIMNGIRGTSATRTESMRNSPPIRSILKNTCFGYNRYRYEDHNRPSSKNGLKVTFQEPIVITL